MKDLNRFSIFSIRPLHAKIVALNKETGGSYTRITITISIDWIVPDKRG